MKNLIKFCVVVGVIYFIFNNKHNGSTLVNQISNISDNNNYEKLKNVVYEVRGLGNVDQNSIRRASSVINEFYGFTTYIKDNVNISDDMFIRNTNDILNASICLKNLNTYNVKTIFITDKELWATGDYVNGLAYFEGNVVIISTTAKNFEETIKHEVGHTLGLSHCSEKTCVMASANDNFETGKFCDNCKNHFVIRFDIKQ